MRFRQALGRLSFVVLVGVLAGCGPQVESFFIDGTVGRPRNVIGRDIGISADIAGQATGRPTTGSGTTGLGSIPSFARPTGGRST